MTMLRLTMAQALVRYLAAQRTEFAGRIEPLFAGVWAIFGHGNVAGLGEALWHARDRLPTFRAHNEQAMAHAAIAFAKASCRRRMMACTSSIGPGATNMVTAAAVAHVNRLPVLLLPGDVFASRRPDPVLQQVEDFADGTISAFDCFRPVSRYWDRIYRPEQLLSALPEAMRVLTSPAETGTVTLAMPQDTQAALEGGDSRAHQDAGGFTMLQQDDVGGLEIKSKSGEWLIVPPVENSFVVNIGDSMRMWTNNRFASTLHRVVNHYGRERYSVGVFANPDYDTVIRPLSTCVDEEHPATFDQMLSGEALLFLYSRVWPSLGQPERVAGY